MIVRRRVEEARRVSLFDVAGSQVPDASDALAHIGELKSLVFLVAASCGKGAPAPAPTPLPAAAAGTSSAAGPGVPTAFSGTISNSIELTDEERAAIAKANELSAARDLNNRIRTSLAGGTP